MITNGAGLCATLLKEIAAGRIPSRCRTGGEFVALAAVLKANGSIRDPQQ
jgi:hypothetical protein